MAGLRDASVAMCGVGAVGSNLAMNLARQGFASFILIDHDRVEAHNLGTQIWSEAEVGLEKVACLHNRLFDELSIEAEKQARKLTAQNAGRLLRGASMVVDSFDNSDSRAVLQACCLEQHIPCLHVGLNADYAEVIWNERYRVPSDQGEDICNYPLARNLILLAVAVAAESLVRFVSTGEKSDFTITLRRLRHQGDVAADRT